MNNLFYNRLRDKSIDKIFIENSQFLSQDVNKKNCSTDELTEIIENYFSCLHSPSDYSKITIYKMINDYKKRYLLVSECYSAGTSEAMIICDKELVSTLKTMLNDLGYSFQNAKKLKRK